MINSRLKILLGATALVTCACVSATSSDYPDTYEEARIHPHCRTFGYREFVCGPDIDNSIPWLRDDYCPEGEYTVQASGTNSSGGHTVGHYCSGDVPEGFTVVWEQEH